MRFQVQQLLPGNMQVDWLSWCTQCGCHGHTPPKYSSWILYLPIECFHHAHTSVFFRYTADMLVSNIRWSVGKKHFRCRFGTTQATNHPSLAYYNTDNNIFSICEPCTGSFVCCLIATAKVLFPNWPLYVVVHQHVGRVMEEYGRARTVKTLH